MNVKTKKNAGYSIIELLIAMTIMLVLMGIVSTLFARSLGTRDRESRKTDALTSAQAALNVMSHEIANSGFGLTYNGIVAEDSGINQLHFRSNFVNIDLETKSPGEDVTYYYEATTDSIVRYDPNAPTGIPKTSAIISKISKVTFLYFNYSGSNSTPTTTTTPTINTGRVRITISVQLEEVQGQPTGQSVSFTSDVTLRNSNYMLNQY